MTQNRIVWVKFSCNKVGGLRSHASDLGYSGRSRSMNKGRGNKRCGKEKQGEGGSKEKMNDI